ncbi:MAG: PhoU domain-containing protein [Bacilli bacterium]
MQFLNEIDAISTEIKEMYSLVIQNAQTAFDYYLSDTPYNDKLIIDDDKINAYERAIESLCMQILLKETVYSTDFRKVMGALKMVECLERIGDNAFDVKWMADDIKKTKYPLPLKGMDELISVVLSMLKDSFTALIKMDTKLAMEIMERDDIADKLYWKMCSDLAKEVDEKKIDGKKTVLEAHVYKYVERIADQATNISEWVIYIKSGFHKDRVII